MCQQVHLKILQAKTNSILSYTKPINARFPLGSMLS